MPSHLMELRQLEYPAQQVKRARGIHALRKQNALRNSPERNSPPQQKNRRRNQQHRPKKCQHAKWIRQKRLPELEPCRPRKAGRQSATRARPMRQSQKITWRQPQLGMRSIARRRRRQPTRHRQHGASTNKRANRYNLVGPVVHPGLRSIGVFQRTLEPAHEPQSSPKQANTQNK